MTAPNRNALWARAIVDELGAAGVEAAVIAPGSRSTPLTVALAEDDSIETFSHLDERSAAFFALGRAKRTGTPIAVVSTSGTAAANFHPAVIEANQSRVPLVVLTADRPPALHDSGANQTIDQRGLYGTAVRAARTLPEPVADDRTLRSLRTTVDRAVGAAEGVPPGPIHLNVPFEKPLEPVEVPGDVPEGFEAEFPLAAGGRDGPFVDVARGVRGLNDDDLASVVAAVEAAERGLIVTGPDTAGALSRGSVERLAGATGFPVFADPLSGLRFGPHVDAVTIIDGYDGFLAPAVYGRWPDPDVVLRFGASPTSKHLRTYLAAVDARQFVVDPAGEWREATFTATDLLVTDPDRFAQGIESAIDRSPNGDWHQRLERANDAHWAAVDAAETSALEGRIVGDVVADAPEGATLFVANSMPVRDLDRFGRQRPSELTVLGNRGASGIDGLTSTALGAGSAIDDDLVFVTGDLSYFHDMNGLLALGRFGLQATIVLIDNDGGGIFHKLPIEDFDPPFTTYFETPHGLDFSPTGDLYGLSFASVTGPSAFRDRYRKSLESEGTQVVAVTTDATASHRIREEIKSDVVETLADRP
ncbi:MAG: 2-succinyl-5-enolpyruvyl-6-hydroxy-3-cyclohexene-1-carboxylic-acid synthase [Halanaeroarchaeum sp.]